MSPPKALLFDIGGVCVVSPFQAILDYEIKNSLPPGYINFTISRNAPTGAWHQLERGEITLDDNYFAAFKSELSRQNRWEEYWEKLESVRIQKEGGSKRPVPRMPEIDAKGMFWNMMRMSRSPDPYMYPALGKLKASGKFILAALSNTVIFPAGIKDERNVVFESGLRHDDGTVRPLNDKERVNSTEQSKEIRAMFDTFVSSAHVGLRKPDPPIYKLALEEINKLPKSGGNIGAKDVVFIDDIGQNLRTAKQLGMGTLKVNLGKTRDAVAELERITGLRLLDEEQARL